jgi:hypothetical protein
MDKFKPKTRYRLYLFNTITKERQEALAKHSTQLSLAEAKRVIANILSFDGPDPNGWVYKYEEM